MNKKRNSVFCEIMKYIIYEISLKVEKTRKVACCRLLFVTLFMHILKRARN